MMKKYAFTFTWVNAQGYTARTDTTEKPFPSYAAAARYVTNEERNDKVWRCVSIERGDEV